MKCGGRGEREGSGRGMGVGGRPMSSLCLQMKNRAKLKASGVRSRSGHTPDGQHRQENQTRKDQGDAEVHPAIFGSTGTAFWAMNPVFPNS